VKLLKIIFIGVFSLMGCTVSETQSARSTQVNSLDLGDSKCEVKDIAACTTAAGGLSCFTRCGFQPSDKFCKIDNLNTCLTSGGGNGCYKKHCGDDAHSGEFVPARGSKLEVLPASGYGYETFDVTWMRYGKPQTIARIKELAIRVYNKTGVKIYVGDISDKYGGNGGRHSGHHGGLEIDIAVMGNTPTVKCYNIWESCYMRPASEVLLREVKSMGGATSVLFNDSALQSKFPGFVGYARGHDNHYHVNWHK
jgi:hypothetical protein